jgi:hypothetical protein
VCMYWWEAKVGVEWARRLYSKSLLDMGVPVLLYLYFYFLPPTRPLHTLL